MEMGLPRVERKWTSYSYAAAAIWYSTLLFQHAGIPTKCQVIFGSKYIILFIHNGPLCCAVCIPLQTLAKSYHSPCPGSIYLFHLFRSADCTPLQESWAQAGESSRSSIYHNFTWSQGSWGPWLLGHQGCKGPRKRRKPSPFSLHARWLATLIRHCPLKLAKLPTGTQTL